MYHEDNSASVWPVILLFAVPLAIAVLVSL